MKYLELQKSCHKIVLSPLNKRISLHGSDGALNDDAVADLIVKHGYRCPRILIFEQSLKGCGQRYVTITKVYFPSSGIFHS